MSAAICFVICLNYILNGNLQFSYYIFTTYVVENNEILGVF